MPTESFKQRQIFKLVLLLVSLTINSYWLSQFENHIKLYEITNVVFYEDDDGKIDLYQVKTDSFEKKNKNFQFVSPKDKSGDLKIKLSYVNPTKYYMHVKLATENKKVPFPLVESEKWKEPYASPFCSMTNGGAEFEPSE